MFACGLSPSPSPSARGTLSYSGGNKESQFGVVVAAGGDGGARGGGGGGPGEEGRRGVRVVC